MPAYENESEENLSNLTSVNSDNTGKNSASKETGFVDNTPEAAKAKELKEMISNKVISKTGKFKEVAGTALEVLKGNKVDTPLGATLAKRLNRENQIASPEELFSEDQIKAHLGNFADGAHAWISPEMNKNIKGEWGWGRKDDKNFVGTLAEADAILSKAQSEKGIFTLEESYGINHMKPWSWANKEKNPDNVMWRYIIPKPKDYNITMPTGKESQAYKDMWIAGGKALGGADEAVIERVPKIQLLLDIAKGKIITEEVRFPNTKFYFDEYSKNELSNNPE
jgi:hypothetical protein